MQEVKVEQGKDQHATLQSVFVYEKQIPAEFGWRGEADSDGKKTTQKKRFSQWGKTWGFSGIWGLTVRRIDWRTRFCCHSFV